MSEHTYETTIQACAYKTIHPYVGTSTCENRQTCTFVPPPQGYAEDVDVFDQFGDFCLLYGIRPEGCAYVNNDKLEAAKKEDQKRAEAAEAARWQALEGKVSLACSLGVLGLGLAVAAVVGSQLMKK